MSDAITTLLSKAATARWLSVAGYDRVTTERLMAAATEFERRAAQMLAQSDVTAKH
jgi:hypothetical protein